MMFSIIVKVERCPGKNCPAALVKRSCYQRSAAAVIVLYWFCSIILLKVGRCPGKNRPPAFLPRPHCQRGIFYLLLFYINYFLLLSRWGAALERTALHPSPRDLIDSVVPQLLFNSFRLSFSDGALHWKEPRWSLLRETSSSAWCRSCGDGGL